MNTHPSEDAFKVFPGDDLPQIVPSDVCLRCDVCCRFPERESFLRPYFTAQERERATTCGLETTRLPDPPNRRSDSIPHPTDAGYICPAFDTTT